MPELELEPCSLALLWTQNVWSKWEEMHEHDRKYTLGSLTWSLPIMFWFRCFGHVDASWVGCVGLDTSFTFYFRLEVTHASWTEILIVPVSDTRLKRMVSFLCAFSFTRRSITDIFLLVASDDVAFHNFIGPQGQRKISKEQPQGWVSKLRRGYLYGCFSNMSFFWKARDSQTFYVSNDM